MRMRSTWLLLAALLGAATARAQAPETTTLAPVEPVAAAPADAAGAPGDAAVDPSPSTESETPEASATSLATPPIDSAASNVDPTLADFPVEAREAPLPSTPVAIAAPVAVSTTPRPAIFEGSVGFAMISRKLTYNEAIDPSLANYSLAAGPSVSFDLRWFPGASFTRGVGAAFGVDLRYDRSFGIESQDRGATFRNAHRIFEIAALGRFTRSRYELVGSIGYGNQAYVFESQTPTTNIVPGYSRIPGVGYAYVRLGAEARVMPFEHVGFIGGLAYLAVVDPGGIGSSAWFPHAKAGGTELRARVVYTLPHHVELRAGISYRRYFLSMQSQVGDPHVAGGAVDHHVALEVGATYRY